MNALTRVNRIETTDTRPYGARRDSRIPTSIMKFDIVPIDQIGNAVGTRHYDARHVSGTSTSVMRFERVARPESDQYETTLTVHPLPHRASAPTEPAQHLARRQEPSAEDKLHARLLSYLALTDDWDGYGAAPPSIDAVLDAVAFLVMRPRDILLPFPQIASDGEVGLYWRTGKVHAEVGFYGDGDLSYYARYTSGSGASRECGSDGYRFDTRGWPGDLLLILGKLAP